MPDVELRIGDLDAERREALEGRDEGGALRGGAYDQVALEADAVDRGLGGLDDLDELDGAVCLGAIVLEVVVIVVSD